MNEGPNILLHAALGYADLGYRVFPCAPGAKVPLTPRGHLDATSDEDQIRSWWEASPTANIGLATTGLLVVDVDGRDNLWLTDEPEKQIEMASAPISRTGNGGQQIFFRQPLGTDLRCTAGRIAPRVDTRANGGYVVVPPSLLDEHRVYRWAVPLDQPPERLPEPPAWLLAALAPPERTTAAPASAPAPAAGNAIPEGQRNASLARLAGAMRRVGMTATEILAALQTANAQRCRPPLDTLEVDRIAASVARYQPDQVATAVAEGHWQQAHAPPGPASVRSLLATYPALREPVIHGLLRRGETMNVIAPPKTGKSWLVTDLALAIATGRPWLDTFETQPGKVLILDNELHGETSANRIPKVAAARGIPIDAFADRVFIQNLRGQLQDVLSLERFFDSLEPGQFLTVILDAFYRFMPRDMDENDNGTMAALYNHIDRYADRLNSCFVLIHHTTKGNQSGKGVTDVGAGAGSQSRATDTHLVLRQHEEPDAVVLDAAVRSWPPAQAMCLRWAFPAWTLAPDLDPKLLRSEGGKRKGDDKPQWTPEAFVEAFVGEAPATRTAILDAAKCGGLSGWASNNLLRSAVEAGLLVRDGEGKRNQPGFYRRPGTGSEPQEVQP